MPLVIIIVKFIDKFPGGGSSGRTILGWVVLHTTAILVLN
jgi:hypothetical protein